MREVFNKMKVLPVLLYYLFLLLELLYLEQARLFEFQVRFELSSKHVLRGEHKHLSCMQRCLLDLYK